MESQNMQLFEQVNAELARQHHERVKPECGASILLGLERMHLSPKEAAQIIYAQSNQDPTMKKYLEHC